ncbi:MAG TPA: membrane dipeptidase [Xanthomonadales bacterium]|nr:membrane dipeptidase [Xanthomonadales bacterium]
MSRNKVSRRQFVQLTVGAVAASPFINLGSYRLFADSSTVYSDRAITLVNESLVMDMLSLLDMGRLFQAEETGSDPLLFTREELLAVKESGIDVFHPAIGMGGPSVQLDAMSHMANYNGLIAEHPDLLMRIDSVLDIDQVRQAGKIGIILGAQNSEHFKTVEDVKRYYIAGQRISQLTYNSQNMIASGATDRADGGISDFGESVVKAMNEIGMAVDTSHCGDQTTLDAFALSARPVLITHSNCRALAPGHPRCKTDEAIRAMATKGGAMGVTAVRNFVKNDEPTTIEHYVDHIDHIVELVGIDFVGIGTDSDLAGYDALPKEIYDQLKAMYKSSYSFREKIDIEGLDHPRKMYDLTEALIRRGYSDDNIRAILGGNFRRVLGEIWVV